MSTIKNGPIGCGDASVGGGKSNNNFLRLNPGSNVIRVVTLPHQYHQHRYEPEGGKKYGYRINCSRTETEKHCPLCEMGNRAKLRWFVGAIDKTGVYKTLDIGHSIYQSITKLASSAWGSPEKYDIDIVVDPNGGATGYYFVSPMPPVPLTAEQIRLMEENPSSILEEKTTPPSPQTIQNRLDKIQEEIETGGNGGLVGSAKSSSNSSSSSDEDEDDFFKDHSKKKAVNS